MFGGLKKTTCDKCNREIANNNFKRHYDSCDGFYFTGPNRKSKAITPEEISEIKRKNKEHLDKVRPTYKDGQAPWNKGLTAENDDRVKKISEGIKNAYKEGRATPGGATLWSKEQYRAHALKNKLGGYNRNAGRGKGEYRKDSFGTKTYLQSSYESKCADILDDMGINWIRPKHLKYTLNGTIKKYFPDFYLPDYDIYLDPKNDYLIKLDKEKIAKVVEKNNITVFVLSKNMITEEYIGRITQR